jgi:hypothetical protein
MEPIMASKGQPIATSSDCLIELVNQFLINRHYLSAERAAIRDTICGSVDGAAASRIAGLLLGLVGGSPQLHLPESRTA